MDGEKRVGEMFVFFYFGLGASASNGENVATRRGVERLRRLCALLDKNGNARLGW